MAIIEEFAFVVKDEMSKYGLIDRGWTYTFDEAKKRLGLCDYRKKELSFSLPYVRINEIEAMQDTILHEIAHALVGPGYGHGHFWKAKARFIGAKPRACNSDPKVLRPEGLYVFTCGCKSHYFHRSEVLGTRRRCRRYGVGGVVIKNLFGIQPAPARVEVPIQQIMIPKKSAAQIMMELMG